MDHDDVPPPTQLFDQPPPTLLGRHVGHPIAAADMELWPVPANVDAVDFHTDELQAVCPVTGQPDLYAADIAYGGRQTFESKGLKHFLWSLRDMPIGAEELAGLLAEMLTDRLGSDVTVTLTQAVRGGLTLSVTATGSPTP